LSSETKDYGFDSLKAQFFFVFFKPAGLRRLPTLNLGLKFLKFKKRAKNSYGGYQTEFVPEVQKSKGSIGGEVSKLNGKGNSGEPNFSGQTAE
jgi:hypothetical protein